MAGLTFQPGVPLVCDEQGHRADRGDDSLIEMKLHVQILVSMAILGCGLLWPSNSFSQKPAQADADTVLDATTPRKDLYPADADARKVIDDALKHSVLEKKRVLLIFGGNWCYDCHVLDRALHEGAAGKIVQESFILVHVDIGEGDKNLDLAKLYTIPLEKGVPAVAILRSDGSLLYSSGAGEFEAARRMMKKGLVAFLSHWKEKK